MKITQELKYGERYIDPLTQANMGLYKAKRTILAVVGLAAMIFGDIYRLSDGHKGNVGTVIIMIGIIMLLVAFIRYRQMVIDRVRNQMTLLDGVEKTLVVDEKGVRSIAHRSESEKVYPWENCTGIKEMEEYICIVYLRKKVILLEKNSLSDEEKKWVFSHRKKSA